MLVIDKDGTISIYQGDSGEVVVDGLNSEESYTVYMAIQDGERNTIGEELSVAVSNATSVTFVLTPELTDLLTVPKNMPYKVYYYGIKVCIAEDSVEDTLFIAGGTYGDLNRIIVYPRKVKGTTNG